jgi:hypothetical protein
MMTSVRPHAIAVAGRIIRDPARAIVEYLELHGGTVTHYDFRAGTFGQIDLDLIRATRSPWMGSRISATETAWFTDRGVTAPWATVPPDGQLKEANPLAADGPYDQAVALWEHFWDARPAGVSTAKVSKVLYLMRPRLFPILDSHLTRFYKAPAGATAANAALKRRSLARYKTLYWEAIRQDILDGEQGLRGLREELAETGIPWRSKALGV